MGNTPLMNDSTLLRDYPKVSGFGNIVSYVQELPSSLSKIPIKMDYLGLSRAEI